MRITSFFLIFLMVLVAGACTSENTVVVRLKIENADGYSVSFEELKYSEPTELESKTLGSSGRVKFTREIRQPGYYQIRFDNGINQVLVLKPGDRVEIRADMDEFHATRQISGSELTGRVALLHDSLRSVNSRLRQLESEYRLADTMRADILSVRADLEKEYLALRSGHHRYSQGFILEDLQSLANIAALYQEYGPNDYVMSNTQDLQFFKLVSDTLYKYYPKVAYVRALRDNYRTIFTQYQQNRLAQMATVIEEDVPDLQLPNASSRLTSLSGLKGKVVLLTFWSVNQPESRANTVALQKPYARYAHQGFEIYQVAVDKSVDDWKKALKFEEIPWVSVIDTAFPGSKTRMVYNVTTLPMNYLIDAKQEKILARNVSPEMLERILPGMLSN